MGLLLFPPICLAKISDSTTTSILIAEADGFRRPKDTVKKKYDIEFGFQNTGGTVKVGCPDKYKWHAYGYFRFDLARIQPENIQKATLRLYNRHWHWKKSIQAQYPKTYVQVTGVSEDSWDERAMIWNGNPATDNFTALKYGISKGWNEIDVTDFIKAQSDNKASFRVGLSEKLIAVFISREGRKDWRPQLVIQHTDSAVLPEPEPEIISTSKLPEGSIWLVHKGQWKQYVDFRDPKGRLHYALQEAMYNAKSGDEIVLGPGRHYQRVRTWDKYKKPVNNVVIRGDGFPRPMIDGSGVESFMEDTWNCTGIIHIFQSSDITVKNLEIANLSDNTGHGSHWSAIRIEASEEKPANNTKIINVYAHHAGNGIHSNKRIGDLTIENCEFAYNGYYGGGGQQHGVYLEGTGINRVFSSEFHHNGGQGYKSRFRFTILSGNYIHDNGNYEFDFMQNNILNCPQDAIIMGNLIVKSPYAMNYSKIGAFGGGVDGKCKPGKDIWPQCKSRHGGVASFINNTFVFPEPKYCRAFLQLIDPHKTREDAIQLTNNIFYSAGASPKTKESLVRYTNQAPQNITGSHNWISPHVAINGNLTQNIPTDKMGDPGFVDISRNIFYLSQNSPNRNAGTTDVKELPDTMYMHKCSSLPRKIKEDQIDVGAYEYNAIPLRKLQIVIPQIDGAKITSHIPDANNHPVDTDTESNYQFYHGSRVMLLAQEPIGARFSHWTDPSGKIISRDNPCSIAMEKDTKIRAHFSDCKVCSLQIIVEGNGSGIIKTDKNTRIDTHTTEPLLVNQGSRISLEHRAAEDSIFSGWSGGDYSGSGNLSICVNEDLTLHALFEKRPQYQVIVNRTGTGSGEMTALVKSKNGTETPLEGEVSQDGSRWIFSLPAGYTIKLSAAPNENSSFAGWETQDLAATKLGFWEHIVEEPIEVNAKFIDLSYGTHWGQTKVMPKSTTYWDFSYISQGGIIPKNALINAINLYLGPYVKGNNDTAVALYAGGISNTNPKNARLIWDAGIINPGNHTGWFTLEYPGRGIPVVANTRLWIRIKNLGRSRVYFGKNQSNAGDFFPTGAFDDKFDWKTTFEEQCPGEGSGTVNRWFSVFLTYTPMP